MRSPSYYFSHRLTIDAAYAALLAKNRRLLHSVAATALAQNHQPGTAGELELLSRLVEHYRAAGEPERAYEQACKLLTLLATTGRYEGWADLLAQADAIWAELRRDDPALPEQSSALLWAQALQARLTGAPDRAESQLRQMLAQAGQASDLPNIILARTGIATVLLSRGEFEAAHASLVTAVELATQLGDQTLLCRVYNQQGTLLHKQGRNLEAAEVLTAAVELAQRTGNLRNLGVASGNLGVVMAALGNDDRALECYTTEMEAARQTGDLRGEHYATSHIAHLHLEHGRLAEARRWLTLELSLGEQLGDADIGFTQGGLGQLSEAEGNLAEAEDKYSLALAATEATGYRHLSGLWLRRRARVRLRRGDLDGARSDLQAAEPLLRAGDPLHLAYYYCALAQLELAARNLPEARQALDSARAAEGQSQAGSDPEARDLIAELERELAAESAGQA